MTGDTDMAQVLINKIFEQLDRNIFYNPFSF